MSRRDDLQWWAAGATHMQNMIGTVQGPAIRRPGTTWLRSIPRSSGDDALRQVVRLVPFVVNDITAYTLVFQANVCRVYHVIGGPVLDALGDPIEIDLTWNDLDLIDMTWVQSINILVLTSPFNAPIVIRRRAENDWVAELLPFQDGPYLDEVPATLTVRYNFSIGKHFCETTGARLINDGGGFRSDDHGRFLRYYSESGWRVGKIDTVVNEGQVLVEFNQTTFLHDSDREPPAPGTVYSVYGLRQWSMGEIEHGGVKVDGARSLAFHSDTRLLTVDGFTNHLMAIDISGASDYPIIEGVVDMGALPGVTNATAMSSYVPQGATTPTHILVMDAHNSHLHFIPYSGDVVDTANAVDLGLLVGVRSPNAIISFPNTKDVLILDGAALKLAAFDEAHVTHKVGDVKTLGATGVGSPLGMSLFSVDDWAKILIGDNLTNSLYLLTIDADQVRAAGIVGHLERVSTISGMCRREGMTQCFFVDHENGTLEVLTHGREAGYRRWKLGLYNSTDGWPSAVALWQSRLFLSGQPAEPNRVTASVVDQFWNFRPGPNDNDGLNFFLADKERADGEWMLSHPQGLVIGTLGNLLTLGTPSRGAPITPTSVRTSVVSHYGMRPVNPVAMREVLIAAPLGEPRLFGITYGAFEERWEVTELSKRAEHLFDSPIWELHRQDEYIWCILESGNCVLVVYDAVENTIGMSRFETRGKVLSMCVAPDLTGSRATLCVERNGILTMELLSLWDGSAYFLDATVERNGLSGAVFGMDHLEGADVVVVDQTTGEIVDAAATVAGGGVVLSRPVEYSLVGLPVDTALESHRLPPENPEGSYAGRKKRLRDVVATVDTAFPFWARAGGRTRSLAPDSSGGELYRISVDGEWTGDVDTVRVWTTEAGPFTVKTLGLAQELNV